MINNKKILAICPARGGSKGITLKNLRLFLGIPLVARVGTLISEIPSIDRAIVSTDHPKIAEVARQSGLDAPFIRPKELSGDKISDVQVLTHALKEIERIDNANYDVIVMLQPTSPLRRKEHVVETMEKLVHENWDAVWTVSETDAKHHPLKQLTLEADQLSYYDVKGDQIIARQQLSPVYHRNGVAYAITRDCLVERETIKGPKTGGLLLEGHFVSIDTMWDLQLAEFIAEQDGSYCAAN